jgi:hypothetical protein
MGLKTYGGIDQRAAHAALQPRDGRCAEAKAAV